MNDSTQYKTVLILDRHPTFSQSSNHRVDFDLFHKNKTSSSPIPAIFKSLWTCNVEAILQYVRIVYDLFPSHKLLHLIVNDQHATAINTSNQKTQNLQHISLSLALKAKDFLQKPPINHQHNVVNGILLALKILAESDPLNKTSGNVGRIVVLGSFGGDEGVARLEECVDEALKLQNQLVLDGSTCIKQVHLVLVDIVPFQESPSVTPHPSTTLSHHLTSHVISSQSGEKINDTMVRLVMQHFGLVITTVTGIPMKEEQNVHSSANYDVQLLHSETAHHQVLAMGLLPTPIFTPQTNISHNTNNPHNTNINTNPHNNNTNSHTLPLTSVPLKWCTPKNTHPSELHPCHHAHRATPLDVTSRPSLCLTNFLLAGRSVMLELNKPPLRLLSHMLTSHAGEIFIHSLATFRSPIDHPPSISDGRGGRLTDYRVQDYGEVLKMVRLLPQDVCSGGSGVGDKSEVGNSNATNDDVLPIEKGKQLLERVSRYWPMTMNESLIFNMNAMMEPLTTNLVKKSLSELEVVDCLKVIYQVVSMKTKNETLNIASSLRTGKSNKREDQYRQLWAELEQLIRCHSTSSANHNRVLVCLLDYKKPDNNNNATSINDDDDGGSSGGGGGNGGSIKCSDKMEDSKATNTLKRNHSDTTKTTPTSKKFRSLLNLIFDHADWSFPQAYKEFCAEEMKVKKLPFVGKDKAVDNKTQLYQHLKENKGLAEEEENKNNNNINNNINNNNINNNNINNGNKNSQVVGNKMSLKMKMEVK